MSSSTSISVRGLCKDYTIVHDDKPTTLAEKLSKRLRNPFYRPHQETFRALDDVSFDINKGEVVGIIGRNGAGKSTLLKVLSRITEPSEGEIQLFGRVGSLLEVGTGFHPELTGRENIFLNGAILGMSRREIRKHFDEIVSFAEVEKFLDTPVKRYSSGMYVRLAFAVAAHLNPEILIVDEVLAVGDAQFQKKCLGKMKEVAEGEGRTVLFVSHNMAAIRTLCTQGIFLSSGGVKAAGTASEIVNLYQQSQSVPSVVSEIKCGDFSILQFHLSSLDGGHPRTFEPAVVEMKLRCAIDCSEIGMYLGISDLEGILLAGVDTRQIGFSGRARANEATTIRFVIENFPLLPGDYRVKMNIRNDVTFKAHDLPIEYPLSVVESQIYGSAVLKRQWHGVVGLQVKPILNCSECNG